jgi:hypothetical protein
MLTLLSILSLLLSQLTCVAALDYLGLQSIPVHPKDFNQLQLVSYTSFSGHSSTFLLSLRTLKKGILFLSVLRDLGPNLGPNQITVSNFPVVEVVNNLRDVNYPNYPSTACDQQPALFFWVA